MAPIAIVFGALLMLLSIGFYFPAETKSVTIFIPAFFGAALLGLGALARQEKLRMHAMHAAAGLGLVGFVVPAFLAIRGILQGRDLTSLAILEQLIMALLCAAFVVLCVKSFVDARRRRKEEGL